MDRRSFIASILAAAVAPAFVGSRILMPVRVPWVMRQTLLRPITPAAVLHRVRVTNPLPRAVDVSVYCDEGVFLENINVEAGSEYILSGTLYLKDGKLHAKASHSGVIFVAETYDLHPDDAAYVPKRTIIES